MDANELGELEYQRQTNLTPQLIIRTEADPGDGEYVAVTGVAIDTITKKFTMTIEGDLS